jgi:hypothetical protein
MPKSRKSIERANELQGTSVAAWYLAVCFMVVMLGGAWVANSIGWVDFGSEQGPAFDKTAVAAAAKKAANREAQARQAAQQEAQNLAEDSARAAVVSASPVATASAKVEAAPAEQASAAPDSQ